jgi:hypothetical protein
MKGIVIFRENTTTNTLYSNLLGKFKCEEFRIPNVYFTVRHVCQGAVVVVRTAVMRTACGRLLGV